MINGLLVFLFFFVCYWHQMFKFTVYFFSFFIVEATFFGTDYIPFPLLHKTKWSVSKLLKVNFCLILGMP